VVGISLGPKSKFVVNSSRCYKRLGQPEQNAHTSKSREHKRQFFALLLLLFCLSVCLFVCFSYI